MKAGRRLLKRRLERALTYGLAGALLGLLVFSTGWEPRSLFVGALTGALFFGLPALLPRWALEDQASRTGAGVLIGALCGLILYFFGDADLPRDVWLVGLMVFGGFFFAHAGDLWRWDR